jgi:hypothetical protein
MDEGFARMQEQVVTGGRHVGHVWLLLNLVLWLPWRKVRLLGMFTRQQFCYCREVKFPRIRAR